VVSPALSFPFHYGQSFKRRYPSSATVVPAHRFSGSPCFGRFHEEQSSYRPGRKVRTEVGKPWG